MSPGILSKRSCLALLLCALWHLALCPPRARAQSPSPDGAEIIELSDKALILKVWKSVHPDSALPRGEFQILIPSGIDPAYSGPSGTVYLLRDGTEAGQLSLEQWDALSATTPKTGWWKRAWVSPESRDAPTVWPALGADWRTWLSRAEWPSGIMMGVGSGFSNVPHASVQFERRIDFAWNEKLFDHFLLGAALHRSQFGGGLTYAYDKRAASSDPGSSLPDFWGDPYWWWSMSFGIPGVRYTASLANRPLPEYFWLETKADSLIRHKRSGRVVRQWTGSSLELPGNLAHAIDFRLSYFRYGLRLDGDAYSSPIQTFGFEDVPAFLCSWGAGVVAASGVAATRVWIDIPDLAFTIPAPSAYPTDFRLAFLRLDFTYRTLRSFSLGLAVTVKLDNPIFNLPGA